MTSSVSTASSPPRKLCQRLVIRECRREDIEHVRAFVAVARHRGGCLSGAVHAGDCAADWAAQHGRFLDVPDGPSELCAWVATVNGAIVGFLAVRAPQGFMQVLELIVEQAWRGVGIGSRLLAAAECLAESYDLPLLTAVVRGTDVGGLAWLCRRGWYVQHNEDGRPAIHDDVYADCDALVLGFARVREGV